MTFPHTKKLTYKGFYTGKAKRNSKFYFVFNNKKNKRGWRQLKKES
jgi:hypothetical protein